MNTKIRSLKKVSSCGPQRPFGYNFRNEFDMPALDSFLLQIQPIGTLKKNVLPPTTKIKQWNFDFFGEL